MALSTILDWLKVLAINYWLAVLATSAMGEQLTSKFLEVLQLFKWQTVSHFKMSNSVIVVFMANMTNGVSQFQTHDSVNCCLTLSAI